MLMSQAVGFIEASSRAPIRPLVSPESGTVSTTKSARPSAVLIARGRYVRSTPATLRPLRDTPTTRMPNIRAARAMSRPISPRPTTDSVAPPRRKGSTGAQRRSRCWRANSSMCWVTQRHQPSVYSAIQAPKTPAIRVTTTRGESSGTRNRSTPGPHHLDPAKLRGLAEQRRRELPGVQDLGVADERRGFLGRGGDAHGHRAPRRTDQVGKVPRERGVGVVDEDGTRCHAPISVPPMTSARMTAGF